MLDTVCHSMFAQYWSQTLVLCSLYYLQQVFIIWCYSQFRNFDHTQYLIIFVLRQPLTLVRISTVKPDSGHALADMDPWYVKFICRLSWDSLMITFSWDVGMWSRCQNMLLYPQGEITFTWIIYVVILICIGFVWAVLKVVSLLKLLQTSFFFF